MVFDTNDRRNLLILLGLAGAIRVYLYFCTPIISLDGAFQFIPLAKLFAEGNLKAGLSHGQLPLYPILIASLSKTSLDFETSGRLVSLVSSLMTVLPLYFLAKKLFNSKIALIGCMFFAIHPYFSRFSVDVLKDSLYISLFVFSVWLGWEALCENRLGLFFVVGVFGGLTYLTRPDGLEILLVMVSWILLYRLAQWRKDYVRRIWAILLLCTSVLLLAVPYVLYIHKTTGRWTISRTKHITALLGTEKDVALRYFGKTEDLGDQAPSAVPSKAFSPLSYLLDKSQKIFHPLLAVFFLMGLITRKTVPFRKGELYLLSFFVLHSIILYLFLLHYTVWGEGQLTATHLSRRHFLPLVALSFPWMGVGFCEVYDRSANWIERRKFLTSNVYQKVFIILLVIIFGCVLSKTLKSVRREKIGRKAVGFWIRNQGPKNPLILTDVPRVAYYAEGDFVIMNRANYEENIPEARKKGIQYVVIKDENIEKKYPRLRELTRSDFSLQEVPQLTTRDHEKYLVFKAKE